MKLLYVAGIRFYAFFLRIASLFHPKAKDWVEGRKQLWKSLPNVNGKEVFWFHCASLGEFDQGLPVMNLLRQEEPNAFILVTFFSPSGYNHYHKRTNPVDFACYIPLDTAKNAKRFVTHFKPKTTFFIKYEFWTNHILELKKNKSQLYSVSTSLRASQHYFKSYGGFFRNTLMQFNYFFAQNQTTVDLLNSINIKNVMLTGDTRFDRVIENKQTLVENPLIKQFVGNSKSVFIAGSTWKKDEELLSELIHSNRFEKYIIAPHNVDSAHVNELIQLIKKPVSRYSLGEFETNILIIDTIGQLASAYSYGSIAYVGGGFSGNLHNILEPAVFGLPVVFGPKFSRYPEAQLFIDEGIGFTVSSQDELNSKIDSLIQNRAQIAQKSVLFVEKNKGASKKIMKSVYLRKIEAVKVKIIAFADDSQPGWVRCVLTDVFGKDWYFTEKIPIVTDEYLCETSVYPCDGVINCIILSEKDDTVVIDTHEPFSINSEDYESKFTVLKSQLIEKC